MSVSTVTLRDGYQIPETTFVTTSLHLLKIIAAIKRGSLFEQALSELLQKCKDVEYSISPQADPILREYGLIDQNGYVPKHVKKVVFNSIQRSGDSVILVNPLKNEICKL